MNKDLLTKLDLNRKELLDLGLRNALVNHQARAKQVRVVDERSSEIFRILVREGRRMSFDPLSDDRIKLGAAAAGEDPAARMEDLDWDRLLAQPDDTGETPANRHTDNRLQTALGAESLQKRLLSIHNDARGYIEEQGVNILFIALGFLHWYEAPSSLEPRRAPLLLVPVELERSSAQERFQLAYTDEDIGDNLSLVEKLRAEFRITLPSIGEIEELDADAYFAAVAGAIGKDQRWKVEPNDVTLGFFSFGKFLMYRDLDGKSWAAGEDATLLSSLLSDGFRQSESLWGANS